MRTLTATIVLVCIVGCSEPSVTGIPAPALLVQDGAAALSYTATDNGTLYLRDQPADKVVYEGSVNAGQRLEVDARANRLTLDGRALTPIGALRPDATYQVYFKPLAKREYHPMMTP